MRLRKVSYAELNARQREVFNYQKVAGHLAEYGFNCIKLTDDWQGADFLAYHKDGNSTLKVQLKSRLVVSKKYHGKSLYMAFPIGNSWHLVEHDHLLELIKEHTTWLTTESWRKAGGYSSANPNPSLVRVLSKYRL
jgi:hypothetical protein